MTYTGHVENGTVVLEPPAELPEGALVEISVVDKTHSALDVKPIWEIALELANSIPEEDLEALPKDGAVNHDHYLYGTEKREP